MNIAIAAPSATFPKLAKLAQLLKKWAPLGSKHSYKIYCTKLRKEDIQRMFDGLDIQLDDSLPGVNRHQPMLDNEVFQHIASKETTAPWFLLTHNTVPLSPDWADKLASELLQSGKNFLGCAAYTPKMYKDHSGIQRASHGDPYLLEAAVYPPNLLKSIRTRLLNATTHHESLKARETFHMAHLSGLIANAEYSPNFRLGNAGSAVLVTRLLNEAVIDELLGYAVPPPATEKVVVEVPTAPAYEPFVPKEPTIAIMSKKEALLKAQMEKDLETIQTPDEAPPEEDSTIPLEEVTVPVKRKPGRPPAKR
jgi:hypothetical protein